MLGAQQITKAVTGKPLYPTKDVKGNIIPKQDPQVIKVKPPTKSIHMYSMSTPCFFQCGNTILPQLQQLFKVPFYMLFYTKQFWANDDMMVWHAFYRYGEFSRYVSGGAPPLCRTALYNGQMHVLRTKVFLAMETPLLDNGKSSL